MNFFISISSNQIKILEKWINIYNTNISALIIKFFYNYRLPFSVNIQLKTFIFQYQKKYIFTFFLVKFPGEKSIFYTKFFVNTSLRAWMFTDNLFLSSASSKISGRKFFEQFGFEYSESSKNSLHKSTFLSNFFIPFESTNSWSIIPFFFF